MPESERSCRFCGQPGIKRRVQVLPWKYECIYVCRADEPKIMDAITELRQALLP